MKWTDQRVTKDQLSHRSRFGYEPDRPLTKGEASHLIRDLEACREGQAAVAESDAREATKCEPYQLRAAVENAKRAVAQAGKDEIQNFRHDLALAVVKRQEFWMDTCCGAEKMHPVSMRARDLYQKCGCGYAAPTPQQAQDIFDALDAAMPFWDRDQQGLFYRTLELNFPELLRHTAGSGS